MLCVLIAEVTSLQRSFDTLQFYTGTKNSVLVRFLNSVGCKREVPLYTCIILLIESPLVMSYMGS